MVYAPVRSIIAKARGLSLRTGAQTMLYLSLVQHYKLNVYASMLKGKSNKKR